MVGWTAVVVALALSVIAIVAVIFLVAQIQYLKELQRLAARFEALLTTLDRDARPALNSLRSTAEEGNRLVTLVRAEAEALADTTRGLRSRVEGAADRLGERFAEFETLADLLQDEVEETVLDVAAALRTTRRGAGILGTMKRAFFKAR